MAGCARADLFVTRVSAASAGVARHDVVNTAQLIVNSLQAPETAACQSGHFFLPQNFGHLILLTFHHAHLTITFVLYQLNSNSLNVRSLPEYIEVRRQRTIHPIFDASLPAC